MYCETECGATVEDIRSWMGDFSAIKTVAKYMSRMGQCFTQAQNAFDVAFDSYIILPDILGGFKPGSGERYIFSDGIGKISLWLAKKVMFILYIAILILHLFYIYLDMQ